MPMTSSTPLSSRSAEKIPELTDEDISKLNFAPRGAIVKAATVLSHVCEAIKTIGVPNKGASLQGIKKWISDVRGSNAKTLALIKKAILQGLESGEIARAKGSKCHGITGSFVLGEAAASKVPAKTELKQKPVVSKSQNIKETIGAGSVEKKAKLPKSDSKGNKKTTSEAKSKTNKTSKTVNSKNKPDEKKMNSKGKPNTKLFVAEIDQASIKSNNGIESKAKAVRKFPSKPKDNNLKSPDEVEL